MSSDLILGALGGGLLGSMLTEVVKHLWKKRKLKKPLYAHPMPAQPTWRGEHPITLILAGSANIAANHAAELRIPKRSYRYVRDAQTLRGYQDVKVLECRTFWDRKDCDEIMANLKACGVIEHKMVDC